MSIKRQAVIVIHGIGEQRPMDTLRSFVNAVWRTDTSIHHAHGVDTLWSKPESHSATFELRKLSTGRNVAGIQTDFFEFYWQHLMSGNTLGHVWSWLKVLLLRSPSTVPQSLRGVYWLLWGLVVVAAVVLALLAAPEDATFSLPAWAVLLFSAVVIPLVSYLLRRIVGDAARYLHPSPENIKSRRAIREAGVALLESLHNDTDTDTGKAKYDRLMVVGHSLGALIGYDLLIHTFPHRNAVYAEQTEPVQQPILETLESHVGQDWDAEVRQIQQRALFTELQGLGNAWRVSDFISIGAPLAHAQVLLAANTADLSDKQDQRELPTCPPVLEVDKENRSGFAYPPLGSSAHAQHPNKPRVLHHAAMFGPTRWTNLYAPAQWIVLGDVIGGPVAGLFGLGVRDVPISMTGRQRWLSHTKYWQVGDNAKSPALTQLRRALDLVDDRARTPEAEDAVTSGSSSEA